MFIQSELDVDSFLADDDPRFIEEDPTDRFDYTFLFGDLNFRLEISRLHADWLVSRRDYAQALGFDQLRMVMQHGDAFAGFKEGDIHFPPTFKYDVLRTLKRPKSKPARSSVPAVNTLVEEPEVENGDMYGDNDDAGSFASFDATSLNCRQPYDRKPAEDDYYSRKHLLRASTGNLVQKVKEIAAAQKAKRRLLIYGSPVLPSLLPNNSISPMFSPGHSEWADMLNKSSWEGLKGRIDQTLPLKTTPATPILDTSSTKSSTISKSIDRSLLGPPLSRTDQSKSISDEEADGNHGVYDSSSKKRVPSW